MNTVSVALSQGVWTEILPNGGSAVISLPSGAMLYAFSDTGSDPVSTHEHFAEDGPLVIKNVPLGTKAFLSVGSGAASVQVTS